MYFFLLAMFAGEHSFIAFSSILLSRGNQKKLIEMLVLKLVKIDEE